jgi:hypothetical protein
VAGKAKRRQAAATANTQISNAAAVAARFSETAVVANREVAGRTETMKAFGLTRDEARGIEASNSTTASAASANWRPNKIITMNEPSLPCAAFANARKIITLNALWLMDAPEGFLTTGDL